MSLSELTDRNAVLAAIREFDELGREAFLVNYGFGLARRYFILHNETYYDSKAITGVAHGIQHPELGPFQRLISAAGKTRLRSICANLGLMSLIQVSLHAHRRNGR